MHAEDMLCADMLYAMLHRNRQNALVCQDVESTQIAVEIFSLISSVQCELFELGKDECCRKANC